MKKTLCSILVGTMLAASLIGCGKKDAWIKEAQEQVDSKLTEDNSTEFYLNGEVYSFPCEVRDFLDKGWRFIDNNDAIETLEREYYCSDPITLIDNHNNKITVYVYNDTSEEITFKEGSVYRLLLEPKAGNVMVPGSLTFTTKMEEKNDIDNYMNDDMEKDGDDYTYYLSADDNTPISVTFEITDLTSTTANSYQLTQISYFYDILGYSYDFITDMQTTMEGVLLNDPSYLNEAWLYDCTPQEYIDGYRGKDGYITWSMVWCMGFDFDELTDEQVAMIDDIIAYAYENADLSILPLSDESTATISGTVLNFDVIVIEAQEALLNDYPDLDISNYEYSDECFEKLYEEMVAIYSDPTLSSSALSMVNYTASSDNEYLWDDILYLGIGFVNYTSY